MHITNYNMHLHILKKKKEQKNFYFKIFTLEYLIIKQ